MKKITLILLFVTTICFGQSPENLIHSTTSYVDDYANVFTTEQTYVLDSIIRNFKNNTEISIVTVKNLNNLDVSDFSVKLFNKWGIGTKDNRGLLILFCPSEHKFWTTTGNGIQDRLTDLKCGEFYRTYAKTKFKNGDYYGGTKDILLQYISVLSNDYIIAATDNNYDSSWMLYVIIIICPLLVLVIIAISVYNNKRKEQYNTEYNHLTKSLEELTNYLKENEDAGGKKLLDIISKIDSETQIISNRKYIKIRIKNLKKFFNDYNLLIEYIKHNHKLLTEAKNTLIPLYSYAKETPDKIKDLENKFKSLIFEKHNYNDAFDAAKTCIDNCNNEIIRINTAIETNDYNALEKLNYYYYNNAISTLNEIIRKDNEKIRLAKNAKSYFLERINFYIALSEQARYRDIIKILSKRCNEFDGLNIINSYKLYLELISISDEILQEYDKLMAFQIIHHKNSTNRTGNRTIISDSDDIYTPSSNMDYSPSSNDYSSDNSPSSSDYSSSSDFSGGSSDGGGGGGDW